MLEKPGFRQVLRKYPDLSLVLLDHSVKCASRRHVSCLKCAAVIETSEKIRHCPNPDCTEYRGFRVVSKFLTA